MGDSAVPAVVYSSTSVGTQPSAHVAHLPREFPITDVLHSGWKGGSVVINRRSVSAIYECCVFVAAAAEADC